MTSFCKKSVHSFLSLSNILSTTTTATNANTSNFSSPRRSIPSPVTCSGLTLFTVPGEIPRSNNVVVSSTFKPVFSSSWTVKSDPGGVGFVDDVNGLTSCTESLGFESTDERKVDDRIEDSLLVDGMKTTTEAAKTRRIEKKEAVRKFPPPLSSLSDDGKPNFYLRPVRKDGRLELIEFRVHRPEIFRAFREDGRLRLHLVHDESEDENKLIIFDDDENDGKEEEESIEDQWKFPASCGGGEGFQRCYEEVAGQYRHGHHHNLHGWEQHCVTIM